METQISLFIIKPSEALLIGCAVREYLEAKGDNEYANILYFLSKRLRPFVPILDTETTTEIPASECDSETIRWTTLNEECEIGLSLNDHNCVYRRYSDMITKTTWDSSRRSLLDLLGDLLEPFVSKSFRDIVQFPSLGEKGLSQEIDLICTFDYKDPVGFLSRFQTPEQPDDTDGVVCAIGELINHDLNDFGMIYKAGQSFGQLFAELERWHLGVCREWFAQAKIFRRSGPLIKQEAWTQFLDNEYRNGEYLWIDTSGEEARRRCNESIERVLSRGCVQKCPHAEMSLLNLREAQVGFGNDESLQLLAAKAMASLALGAVLGSMYAGDEEALAKNAASPTPRMFTLSKLSPEAPLERIKGRVLEMEQILSERSRLGISPEGVISFSQNLIEALAKTLWESEFSSGTRKGELRNILIEHRRSGDQDEHDFASIALMLYDTFRNPAQHDLLNFRCTWLQVWLFHVGTRALLELSESIKKKRASD